MSADGAARGPWVPHVALAAVGAAVAWALSRSPPEASGARRLADPVVLLALFDAAAFLLLVRPGIRSAAETVALAAVAAPFHAAAAGAAGAGSGHLACTLLSAAAWAAAALAAARADRRTAAWATTALTFGLPLAAYGAVEFARLPVERAFLASPLTAPVLLAHRADGVAAGDAVPALVAAGALAASAAVARARRGRSST